MRLIRKHAAILSIVGLVCISFLARPADLSTPIPNVYSVAVAAKAGKSSVSYQIVGENAVDYSEDWSNCTAGPYTNKFGRRQQFRAPLHPQIQELTNFSSTISLKNLRILVMGDSVAMQIFHMVDMAAGGSHDNRTVVEYAFGHHYSYALSSTAKIGAWRITDMFLRANENRPPPNEPGGGWNATTARVLLSLPDPSNGEPIQSFDTIVFVIPLPWMKLAHFRASDFKESLQLANEVFGIKKAILLTMPFMNNVEYDRVPMLLEKNREIEALVTDFEGNRTIPGIEGLVMMDFAELMFQFIRANAALLGYLNGTDSAEMPYLMTRIRDYTPHARPAAAHVCAGPMFELRGQSLNFTLCDKNVISLDGIHLCPNAFGGRMVAATGCLLQCLYPDSNGGASRPTEHVDVLECQKECNSKFMTLRPINISAPS